MKTILKDLHVVYACRRQALNYRQIAVVLFCSERVGRKYAAQGLSVVAFSCEDLGTPDDSVAHREAVIVDLMKTTLGAMFPIAWDREK